MDISQEAAMKAMAIPPHICEENLLPVVCQKCGKQLLAHEVEILNMFHEIGAYCENKSCDRYNIIVR